MTRKHNKIGDKRNVLLDSNIVQYLGVDGLKDKIIECLTYAVNSGFDLAISDITFYELIHGAPVKHEIALIQELSGVKRFYVTKKVLIAAAHLGSLYKEDKVCDSQINSGDKFIAATAIITNSVIFTANVRDFPPPFFHEIERRNLEYTSKQRPVLLCTSFVEADINYIVHNHNVRLEDYKKIEAAKTQSQNKLPITTNHE